MTLRLLDERTIGKIAAGEVVERPVSVVKELVENAIDAGATRIRVAVQGGGIELIEVVDDGCGIAPADLPLAVQRHATSKLSAFEDLDSPDAPSGFRGEALPSIGAVSVSRHPLPHGRTRRTPRSCASRSARLPRRCRSAPAEGTAVTVRDLFANVPARRKFLRQPGTETGYIQRAVAAYAATYPAVAFELTIDGRRAFVTDGSGDAIAAATAAWGADVGRAAIPLEPLEESAAVPGVAVDGWITAPELSRSHRQGIVIFVNGRWVQNRALAFALEEAYHSPPPRRTASPGGDPHPPRSGGGRRQRPPHQSRGEVRRRTGGLPSRAARRPHRAGPPLARRAAPHPIRADPHDAGGAATADPVCAAAVRRRSTSRLTRGNEPELPTASRSAHPSGVPMLRVLGQIAASFIIAEGPDGMYLIDQHAAHERVLYERILGQLRERSVDRQPLLDPLVVDLTPEEMAAFERSQQELAEIGFEIDRWDGGAVAVRAVPALVKGVDVAAAAPPDPARAGRRGTGRIVARRGRHQHRLPHLDPRRAAALDPRDARAGHGAGALLAAARLRPWPADDAAPLRQRSREAVSAAVREPQMARVHGFGRANDPGPRRAIYTPCLPTTAMATPASCRPPSRTSPCWKEGSAPEHGSASG